MTVAFGFFQALAKLFASQVLVADLPLQLDYAPLQGLDFVVVTGRGGFFYLQPG